ncbi:MAG: bifunctional enzyme CysN/CysC [Fusobacteria bacterium]|nr:MAG: bifunctional enzyme CysN/CysC [Fusobacteriota bacterium]KAF0230192.1 MAG: bifunctional enzyme [Fusobacteriota bacterium]
MNLKEQMNIVIVGHVDHGKSTVIGRLLADTGSLPDGKLESVKEYCRNNSRPFEYAFLLDALKDEQAQGITIDTARCFFKTNKRDYIIIDAPGHIEFLKNMVTGASRAEAALLVIDAKEGIRENSKRHGHILSMLGVKQVVVLVNKMDLIDYDQEKFQKITSEFSEFLSKIHIKPINYIPISAFNGDNIVSSSKNIPWYKGMDVLRQLDSLKNKKKNYGQPLRLPVQDIYKFTANGDDRRIVVGTILSGKIKVGDEVVFLPSYKKSTVKSIEGFNVPKRDTAYAEEATGITLSKQIYINPGELLVKANEKLPEVSSCFRANIFWVGKAPLVKDKQYKLKIGSTKIPVKLLEIINIIDAAELNIDSYKDQVERHDVAECIFETGKPIAFDIISDIEQTGRFVIVDNYDISGGGIIIGSESRHDNSLLKHVNEREYLWSNSLVSQDEKSAKYGHKSKLIIITSGSEGKEKSVENIAKQIERKLFDLNFKAYYLGISSLLAGLVSEDSIGYRDRLEHIRQLGEVARLFTDSGQILISPIYNLDDYEVDKLKVLNQPNEILVFNLGETPFNNFKPIANFNEGNALDIVLEVLKGQEVIEYYL